MPVTSGYAAVNGKPVDTKGHWAASTLDKWSGNGWLKGTAEGELLPNRTITRAEVAALVNASFGFTEKSGAAFKDVRPGIWYAETVSISAQAGFLQGTAEGHFQPDAAITRQEFAVLIARLLKLEPVDPPALIKDAANAPGWSKGAIGAVLKAGIMVGQTPDSFGLQKPATRAEAVVILDRALGKRTVQAEEKPADKPESAETEKPAVTTPQTPVPPAAGGGGAPVGGNPGGGNSGGGSPTTGLADSYYAVANTVLGGTAITLKSAPPYGTSVWFAEAGTTKFVEGTKQTVLRGNGVATRIAAPEEAGTYRLYAVTGGSASAASLAQLTVANTANIEGTLKNKDGAAIESGTLVLEDVKGNEIETAVSNGYFKLYLPDGPYRAVKVVQGNDETDLFANFGVRGGKLERADRLDLKAYAAANYNVTGDIRFDGETGQTDVDGVALIAEEGSSNLYSVPVRDGRFALYLPAGIYRVGGFESDGEWYTAPERAFVVKEGAEPPASAWVNLNRANISGKVLGADGKAVAKGLIDIRSSGIGGGQYFTTNVRADGTFKLHLPDGPYNFYAFDNGSYSQPIGGAFFVRDGKIAEGVTTVQLPASNFSATVSHGGRIVAEGSLLLGKGDGGTFTVPFKDGKLEGALQTGQYTVKGYSGDYGFYALNEPLEITAGMKNVALTAPTASLKATFTGADVGQNGTLSIVNVNARETYSASVVEGKFEAFLSDGEYALVYYDETSGLRTLQERVVIKNGKAAKPDMSIPLPESNVTGTLSGDIFKPLVKSVVIKSKADPNSTYHAQVLDGQFHLYLPDGDYEVTGYSHNYYENIALSVSFTVKGGATPNVTIPEGKVKGSLVQNHTGSRITSAYLQIRSTGAVNKTYSTPVINGQFAIDLPDGEYRLVGYQDWGPGKFTTLTDGFTVKNGQPQTGSFPAGWLPFVEEAANVEGSLQSDQEWYTRVQLYVLNDSTQELHYIEVRNNKFGAYLPDGSYTIQGYYDTASNRVVELGRPLVIQGGKPKEKPIVLSKDSVQQGTVKTAGGEAAGAGKLRIKTTDENGMTYEIPVKANGAFAFSLPAGEYIVESYADSAENVDYSLNVPFTIPQEGAGQPLALVIAATISGKVQGAAGESLPDGVLSLKEAAGKLVQIRVQHGVFNQQLTDGTYKAESYAIGKTSLKVDFTFEVKAGKADRELTIAPVANAIGGAFAADGTPWEGELFLTSSSPKNQIIELSVVNGLFAGQLGDGTYTIAKLQNGDAYVPVMRTLVVSGGRVTDPMALQLLVPTSPIPVRAQWTDGTAANGLALIVQPHGSSSKMLLPFLEGQAELLLNDGAYVITGYILLNDENSQPFNLPFEIKDGKLIPDPAAIQDGRAKADPFTVLLPKN
ncbi:S-layer family protein [Paenibacillus methanolicus]|uniref:S-layer family protein n=2 Tax=Paenibacillus methanolicus TaxID=582686 RepID=A0A5S5BRQ6_9BACL|nr:S-layer family protein [Paenibacillus methanolicus]